MYSVKVVTAPVAPVFTTAEAKDHLRETDNSAGVNTYIDALVKAATLHTENFLQRKLISTELRLLYDTFPYEDVNFELPFGKLVSFGSIKYYDVNGNYQTLDSSLYQVDLESQLPRITTVVGQEFWPATQAGKINAVEVQFITGFGAASSNVPEDIREAMKLMIEDWYTSRGSEGEISKVAQNLLWQYRLVGFGC